MSKNNKEVITELIEKSVQAQDRETLLLLDELYGSLIVFAAFFSKEPEDEELTEGTDINEIMIEIDQSIEEIECSSEEKEELKARIVVLKEQIMDAQNLESADAYLNQLGDVLVEALKKVPRSKSIKELWADIRSKIPNSNGKNPADISE